MDVDQTDYRYYPQALRAAAIADTDEDTKQWLELAIELDYSARLLIQFALRSAAHRAASNAEPWVELAQEAGADEGIEGAIVKIILGGASASNAYENEQDAALSDRISRLESLASLANTLASDLRAQIGSKDAEGE